MTGLYYNYLINRAYLPPERIVEVTSQWQVEQAHLLDGQRLMLRQKNTLFVIDANWSEIEVDLAPIIKL